MSFFTVRSVSVVNTICERLTDPHIYGYTVDSQHLFIYQLLSSGFSRSLILACSHD